MPCMVRSRIISCSNSARLNDDGRRKHADQPRVELYWILPHCPSQRIELQHIHASLRSFNKGDERLVLSDPLREFCLSEARMTARLRQQGDNMLVCPREHRFRH